MNLGVAEGFAAASARVALMSRSEKVDAAVGGLRALGPEAIGVAADVRDVAATRGALSSAHAEFGEIDVLVSGATGNCGPGAGHVAQRFSLGDGSRSARHLHHVLRSS